MSKRKPLLLALSGLLLVVLAAGAFLLPRLKERWSAPLGPGLELPTYTPAPTRAAVLQSPAETQASVEPTALAQAVETSVPAATQQPTPAPLCGGPETMLILGIGADSGRDYNYGLADVIRIARVDFVTPKVTLLSMPRDLWVEIPEISENYGIDHGKLNQAYFYGGPGMGYYDGPGAGPGLLARTLDLNFGLRVDHYGAVNMQTFVGMVDALGGIDIYLPADVDGTPFDENTEDMGYFYAGQQTFNGEEALRFARIRKRYNDFTRMDHQNMVMCAIKEKVLSPSVLPKIPQLINAFQGQVLTDLSPEQIGQLACLLPHLDSENLVFTGLPDEIFSPGRVYSPVLEKETFVLDADYDVIRDYLDRFVDGTYPEPPPPGSTPAPAAAESTCP